MILGNDSTTSVLGFGDIELKMNSGKILTLKDIHHVPEVKKDLITGSSLIQLGNKIVLETNRVIVFKSNVFVRKK